MSWDTYHLLRDSTNEVTWIRHIVNVSINGAVVRIQLFSQPLPMQIGRGEANKIEDDSAREGHWLK